MQDSRLFSLQKQPEDKEKRDDPEVNGNTGFKYIFNLATNLYSLFIGL